MLGSAITPLLELGGHSHWIWQAKFNPRHDNLLLSASSDSLVNLWHTPVTAGESSRGQVGSRGLQGGLQSKSTPSAAMNAMESSARYAASDAGSPMLVPARMQSQHRILNANAHFAPPTGGQLPSMTGHELTNWLCQSGVQYQQLDQAAVHPNLTGAEQLPLGRSWPGPQAISISETVRVSRVCPWQMQCVTCPV